MPFYPDADTLYVCLDALFERVKRRAPQSTQALSVARFAVRFTFDAPRAEVLFDGRVRPFRTIYGQSPGRADVEVELSADAFHQVLLGNLTLVNAVGNRLIKLRGPVWKVYPLGDMLLAGQQFYAGVLAEQALL